MAPVCADMRQSPGYQQIMQHGGAVVEDLGAGQVGYLFRLKRFPLMSVIVVPRVVHPVVLPLANKLSRKYRSLCIKVAPKVPVDSPDAALWGKELRRHGYALDRSSVAPTKTRVLDLSLTETELLDQMKPKTRYNIRLAQRRGVTTQVIDGPMMEDDPAYLEEFYRVYRHNCERIGVRPFSWRLTQIAYTAFRHDILAVHAYVGSGEIGAVASFVRIGDTLSYQNNGSTESGRRDFAPTLAAWAGIVEAKRRGCRWFDFDAIHDERYKNTEDWKGFTRFKSGFGGTEVTYLGSYVRWLPFLRR